MFIFEQKCKDDVAANGLDGGEVVAHDHGQGDGGGAGTQSNSGESSPQNGDSPRSLGGGEMADHVHDDDDGRALHGQGGRGHMDHINMKDGLVSFCPGKTVCPSKNALVVGGPKSFQEEDPTAAGNRDGRRKLVVQKRMRKMKVADGGGDNKGTIEKYLSNLCVKGMVMNGVSLDFTRNTKRSTEKDDEKRDDRSLGKRLKTTTTVPEHKTAKKTTGVPKLRKRRVAKSRAREEPSGQGMKVITSYFLQIGKDQG